MDPATSAQLSRTQFRCSKGGTAFNRAESNRDSSFPLHIPRFDSVSCKTRRTRKIPRLSVRSAHCSSLDKKPRHKLHCKLRVEAGERERNSAEMGSGNCQSTRFSPVIREESWPRRSFVASFRELWRSQPPLLPPRGKQET